jgi:hypothetical protein
MQLSAPTNPAAARTKQKREDESVIEAKFQIQTYVAKVLVEKDRQLPQKLGAN